MKKYKVSNYNLFFKTDDGISLVFNGISGGFARIKKEDKKRIEKFIKNPNAKILDKEDKKAFNSLLKGRFILHSDIDEISFLKLRFWKARFNNNIISLSIAPTLNCNFKCIYCYEREKKSNLPISMTKEKEQRLMKFISKRINGGAKKLHITWYGGEPLLKINLIEKMSQKIIDLCTKKQILYSANILTNGYLLNKNIFEKILKSKIKLIQVPFDGPPEIHNHFRPLKDGSPTFSIILENIKRFVDFTKGEVRVAIRINIAEENMNTPFELVDILESEDLKNKVIIYPGHIISDNSNLSCLSDNAFSEVESDFLKNLLDRGWEIHLPPLLAGLYCSAYSANSYTIDPQLNLYKCWETIGIPSLKVGYINGDGVIRLNENNFYVLSFDPFKFEECLNCQFLPLCMGGCISKSIEHLIKSGIIEHGKCPSLRHNLLKKLEIYYRYVTMNKNKEER